jgi:hypothetical protein
MASAFSSGARVRVVLLAVLLLASGATIWAGVRSQAALKSPPVTPNDVLAELKAGNHTFVGTLRGENAGTRSDDDRRKYLVKGRGAIAVVVLPGGSRAVPEFVFDQGLGRLVTIHDDDRDAAAVLEDAVDRMHVPLIVVLAHANDQPSTAEQSRARARSYVGKSASLREQLSRNQAALAIGVLTLETGRVEWSDFDPDAEK